MIYVIAAIEVQAGRMQEFVVEFQRIVPLVRAEQGCLLYQPTVDLPTNLGPQEPVRENIVSVLEGWESIEHLEKHLVMPHMIQYRANVKQLVTAVKLQILQPIS